MTRKSNKRKIWWLIGMLVLMTVAWLFLDRLSNSVVPKDTSLSSSTKADKTIDSSIYGQPLQKAIQQLEQQHQVRISFDNPFMEECPFPKIPNETLNLTTLLSRLAEIYQMEIQKLSDKEYLLIGGTCTKK